MITLINFKEKMILKAQKNCICENFGQKELSELKDRINYQPFGNEIEKGIAMLIDDLDKWCMGFDQKELENIK